MKDQGPGMLRWHPCRFGERTTASSMLCCASLDSLRSTASLLRQAKSSCDESQSMKILKSSPGWCCSPALHHCSSAVQRGPTTVPCVCLYSPPQSLLCPLMLRATCLQLHRKSCLRQWPIKLNL